MINISVFGLGYVGCITAACLADAGYQVVGVDIDSEKVAALNQGKSPFFEADLSDIISRCVRRGTLYATSDAKKAVQSSDIAFICVGTPSTPDGGVNMDAVIQVCEVIGRALVEKTGYYTVAIRSTMLPGTSLEHCIPALERFSGKHVGEDIGYCVNPEFLREGNAIADFLSPPYTIIGELDIRSGSVLGDLWSFMPTPLYRVPLGVGEVVKYASNAFHALKIAFANEIGSLCRNYGIDSHEVMRIFVSDTKLNISSRYLQPGNAFGGSCLGKDLRALQHVAKKTNLDLCLLNSVNESNNAHIERIVNSILNLKPKKTCFIGLSFKVNTDDLRESPSLRIIQKCISNEMDVNIFDEDISISLQAASANIGAAQSIPDFLRSRVKLNLGDALKNADLIILLKQLNDDNLLKINKMLGSEKRVYSVDQLI